MAFRREARGRLCSAEVLALLGLVLVYVLTGAVTVLSGGILAAGVDPLFVVYAPGIVTFMFFPLVYYVEREKWPQKLGAKLFLHFLLISLGWQAAYQVLMLQGMQLTSPGIASAMTTLAPGFVFVIACCLKFEKFDVRCGYSQAKVAGTAICVTGAIAMSLLQGTPQLRTTILPREDWIVGCVYLFSAVFIYSCSTVLQAETLLEFPAPLSLFVITAVMSSVFTAAYQFILAGKLDPGHYSMSTLSVVACLITIGVVSTLCFMFQVWCIEKMGPVYMTLPSPIATVTSIILSAATLGKFLNLGSSAGILVMFLGMYVVLCAKWKESPMAVIGGEGDAAFMDNVGHEDDDIEKPILR